MESYVIENGLENVRNIGDFLKGREKEKKNGGLSYSGNK